MGSSSEGVRRARRVACARGALSIVLMLAGCESPALVANDAAAPDAARSVVAPAAPDFGTCPAGWSAPTLEGVPACLAWEAGRPSCDPGTYVVPGQTTCARLGSACPADGLPGALPTGRAIVFVDDDAPPGGDGRAPSTAYASIAEALAATPGPAVIAVATGRYVEPSFALGAGQSLIGACASDTLVTNDVIDGAALIRLDGDASLRDVSLEVPNRPAIRAVGSDVHVEDLAVLAWQVGAIGIAHGHATLDRIALVASAPAGVGIDVGAGSAASVTHAMIVESGGAGIAVHDLATSFEGEDLVVDGVRASGDLEGLGVIVGAGARLALTRVQLSGTTGPTAVANGDGTVLEIRQAVLRKSDDDAVLASDGAQVRVEHAVVERSAGDGFFAGGAGATLAVSDTLVRDVMPVFPSMRYGRGVQVYQAATVTLDRVVVVRAHEAGIWVESSASTLVATDVRVEEVLADVATSLLGAGIVAQQGGSAMLERVSVRSTRTFGMVANVDATIAGHDVSVRDVALADCALTTCGDVAGGFGVTAAWGASVRLDSFEVDGARPCGVAVVEGGGMDLAHGVVSHADVGACVQVPGFDPERLHADVAYEDVGVPLQATTYTLPAL